MSHTTVKLGLNGSQEYGKNVRDLGIVYPSIVSLTSQQRERERERERVERGDGAWE